MTAIAIYEGVLGESIPGWTACGVMCSQVKCILHASMMRLDYMPLVH